jgi:3-methyladenine DNA glycosylase/8-oxoguanine DNA glycosylase
VLPHVARRKIHGSASSATACGQRSRRAWRPHNLPKFVADSYTPRPRERIVRAKLFTHAPFHLEATVRVLQRRPANRVDVWDRNRYLRVLTTADGPVLIEVHNRGTMTDPDVRLSIPAGDPSPATRVFIEQSVRRVLGLDLHLASVQAVAETEPRLRATALALRGMRPPRFPELFEAFASVVPFQQLSLDAGIAIMGQLTDRFGESLEHEGHRYRAFPTARAIANARLEALRRCGLSRGKAQCLRYLAKAIESGELSEAAIAGMSTSHALERLIDLPGIGPWSAGVVLLRGFGRLDVFPPGDVGALRGLRALLHLRTGQSLGPAVKRFGPYRGYLYFCALGSSLLAKGLIHPASSFAARSELLPIRGD